MIYSLTSKLFIIKHYSNKDIVEVILQSSTGVALFTVSGHDLWLSEVIQLRGLYHQFTGVIIICQISPELTVVGLELSDLLSESQDILTHFMDGGAVVLQLLHLMVEDIH